MEGTSGRKATNGKPREFPYVCEKCGCNFTTQVNSKRKLCEACLIVHRQGNKRVCLECGCRFTRKGGKDKGMFCSRVCCWTHKRKQDPEKGLRQLRDYCEQMARREKARNQKALAKLCALAKKLIDNEAKRLCMVCGKTVNDPHCASPGRLCSDRCRRERYRQIRPKGSKKHTTRAKKRGLPRQYSITIQKVGDRDGWICKLCSLPIADHHAREGGESPCIDHIVPLNHKANSRHGHTWNNVQIAHRICNEVKGCTVACNSLFECDNPREHIAEWSIDQTPHPGGSVQESAIKRKAPTAFGANFWGVLSRKTR